MWPSSRIPSIHTINMNAKSQETALLECPDFPSNLSSRGSIPTISSKFSTSSSQKEQMHISLIYLSTKPVLAEKLNLPFTVASEVLKKKKQKNLCYHRCDQWATHSPEFRTNFSLFCSTAVACWCRSRARRGARWLIANGQSLGGKGWIMKYHPTEGWNIWVKLQDAWTIDYWTIKTQKDLLYLVIAKQISEWNYCAALRSKP